MHGDEPLRRATISGGQSQAFLTNEACPRQGSLLGRRTRGREDLAARSEFYLDERCFAADFAKFIGVSRGGSAREASPKCSSWPERGKTRTPISKSGRSLLTAVCYRSFHDCLKYWAGNPRRFIGFSLSIIRSWKEIPHFRLCSAATSKKSLLPPKIPPVPFPERGSPVASQGIRIERN